MMIAIGVLALVSVGLSVIFGSIGSAVTQGRRASAINASAQRIEAQMRADIERMARDGYLVIAQRYASDESGAAFTDVRLSPRDRVGRPRRADELMFFARGDFASKRPPLVSGVQATSGEAAVYYGIGQKRPPDLVAPRLPTNYFFNPYPSDSNLRSTRSGSYPALLGLTEPSGRAANPNRYARDWSLLRQVTLLATPASVLAVPTEVFGVDREQQAASGDRLLRDTDRQIGLQPTARSLFNSLSWTDPARIANRPGQVSVDGSCRWWIGDIGSFPGRLAVHGLNAQPAWRSSGVVDVAQGSITEIVAQMRSFSAGGVTPNSYYPAASIGNPFSPAPARPAQSYDGLRADWLDPTMRPIPAGGAELNMATDANALRAWALDSMPSLWDGVGLRYLAGVRYEDVPTRLVYEGNEFPDNDAGRLGRAIGEANQEMLGSQVFVTRVTEFVVEWSYGWVDQTAVLGDSDFKKMQWYGVPRATRDTNDDGRIDGLDHANEPETLRYPGTRTLAADEPTRVEVLANPVAGGVYSPDFAVFGFTNSVGDADPDNDRLIPWPKFIRVTMSLADPEDQTTERSFQFVFALPGGNG